MEYYLQQDIRDINTELFVLEIITSDQYFKFEKELEMNRKLFTINLN